MAKPKKKEVDQRLLDYWIPPQAAGEPIGCVGTTFTFEPVFFEEHCLSRFLRLETDPREDGAAYLIEREEKLACATVLVLVDRMHADGSASPRWDVISVRSPGGIFHAKISLLAWHGWIRLIIGSANLTEPGYRKNQEVFAVLDFHEGGTVPLNVLTESLDFLTRILSFCPGSPNEAGPKSRLVTLLRNVRNSSSKWTTKPLKIWDSAQVATVFLGAVEGLDGSVLQRLGQLARDRGGPAYSACVLSPFFDTATKTTYPATDELLGALTDRGSREIQYMIRHETLPDGRVRLRAPRSLIESGKKASDFSVQLVAEEISGDFRPLHAKSVWLWNDYWHVYMVGSSNFTSAGLGLAGRASNFEANIAYLFRSNSSVEKWMEQTLPPSKDFGDDFDRVIWEPVDEEKGEDAFAGAVLPVGFEEALFEPGEESCSLVLRFGKGLPANWTITFEALSSNVFSVEEWRRLNSPIEARVTWNAKAVPNQLKVIWTDKLQQEQNALWPVNVTDLAKLAPPDQLRNLTLSTLLDILCSGRPLYEAIAAGVLGNGSNPGGNGGISPELDPLRRISSETFLLQRTRRVAKAIARLMETLSRPVVYHDALMWRLRGPVGPCALAKAIASESSSPGEAAFLLSEIVLVLRHLDTRRISVGVSRKEVKGEISKVIDDLKAMISNRLDGGAIPQSMFTYIAAALRETGA